jgi:hypothetical protein
VFLETYAKLMFFMVKLQGFQKINPPSFLESYFLQFSMLIINRSVAPMSCKRSIISATSLFGTMAPTLTQLGSSKGEMVGAFIPGVTLSAAGRSLRAIL